MTETDNRVPWYQGIFLFLLFLQSGHVLPSPQWKFNFHATAMLLFSLASSSLLLINKHLLPFPSFISVLAAVSLVYLRAAVCDVVRHGDGADGKRASASRPL